MRFTIFYRAKGYIVENLKLAVTVCNKVKEACPISRIGLKAPDTAPAAKKAINKTFKDPAIAEGSDEEQQSVFRHVRDDIRNWIIKNFH